MKAFKPNEELVTLTNGELIHYKKELEEFANTMHELANEFKLNYKLVRCILKDRAEELEYDLMEAEDHRMNCDLAENAALLDFN